MRNKMEGKNLHPTEDNLIRLIRRLKNGRLFLKVRDGLPMAAEVAEDGKVLLNKLEIKDV
jgi:hypothetical protein